MKNNTELWILPHEDVAKGLFPAWEMAILDTLNSLIEHEEPFRTFSFERGDAIKKKEKLIDIVKEGFYLLVLEHKKTHDIIGTVLIYPVKDNQDMIALYGYLHINEKYRRKGYGEHLMKEAETISRKMGCSAVRLAVLAGNRAAREFYTALDYEPTQIYLGKNL